MSPEEIERLFAGTADADAHDHGSAKTSSLGPVLDTANTLWQSGSLKLDDVAKAIADGSRKESWRQPLGDSGILDFFISLLSTELEALRPTLIVQILRLTGNACADTNPNRQRVVDSAALPKLVALLNQDPLLPVVLVVLNNLCNDYEPSQKAAYKAGLNPELVTILSTDRVDQARPFFSIIFRLLEELSSQEPEPNFVHPATPFVLLKLAIESATADNIEDFLGPTPVALTYLSHQQFQDSFVQTPGAVSLLLKAFSVVVDDLGLSEVDADDQERLKKVQSVFIQAIADVSAHESFASSYPLDSEEVQTLVKWLSSPKIAKPTAASLALGNLARSDVVCTTFVQPPLQVHEPLVRVLADPSTNDAQLLHSSLSFLKNLAIPAGNKAILGETELLDNALPRLWGLTVQPQVQFAAVSLTRLLLVQCPPNVIQILSPAGSSAGDKEGTQAAAAATKLNSLLDAFKDSDQEPTKMEAARASLAACRVIHSPGTDLSVTTATTTTTTTTITLDSFYSQHSAGLVRIILHLTGQSKFPTLRSELWFVLALMARSAAGARFLANRIITNYEFLGELTRTITGENMVEGRQDEFSVAPVTADAAGPESCANADEQQQQQQQDTAGNDNNITAAPSVKLELEPQQVGAQAAAGLAKVDRENCIVLVHELVKQQQQQQGRELGPAVVSDVLGRIIKDTPELLSKS